MNESYPPYTTVISELRRDNLGLREECQRLKMALASGLCSAHQEPDPLNCDTCNNVKWLKDANDTRQATIDELRDALSRYDHINL